jgi:hypothetical protein
LWLVEDATGRQWLSFVDPKCLRNIDLNHPKLNLYKEIKVLEKELGDSRLTLNAFILSTTKLGDLLNISTTLKKSDLEDQHILFMDDGGPVYIKKLFDRIQRASVHQ